MSVAIEVSVIVPVRNGADSLPALLDSLGAQTMDARRFEVIVVDNASDDNSAAVAAAWGVHVLRDPVPGRARARNTGAAVATGAYLAFVDADCVASESWLEELFRCASTASLIAGEVSVTTGDPPSSVEQFERLWRFNQRAWVEGLGWAATANLLVERRAFDAVGGFDEAYRSIGEDVDFCLRSSRAGFQLAYCQPARVSHPGEARMWPMLKRSFWHGYSTSQLKDRLGVGYDAWRHPSPLLRERQSVKVIGIDQQRVPAAQWRAISRLSRLAYGARMLGSVWSAVRRTR